MPEQRFLYVSSNGSVRGTEEETKGTSDTFVKVPVTQDGWYINPWKPDYYYNAFTGEHAPVSMQTNDQNIVGGHIGDTSGGGNWWSQLQRAVAEYTPSYQLTGTSLLDIGDKIAANTDPSQLLTAGIGKVIGGDFEDQYTSEDARIGAAHGVGLAAAGGAAAGAFSAPAAGSIGTATGLTAAEMVAAGATAADMAAYGFTAAEIAAATGAGVAGAGAQGLTLAQAAENAVANAVANSAAGGEAGFISSGTLANDVAAATGITDLAAVTDAVNTAIAANSGATGAGLETITGLDSGTGLDTLTNNNTQYDLTKAQQDVVKTATDMGKGLTDAQQAKAAADLKAAADAAKAAGTTWGAQQILQAATLAITAASTVAAIVTGDDTKTETTTDTKVIGAGTTPDLSGDKNPDGTPMTAAQKAVKEYLLRFYGLEGKPGLEKMIADDQTADTGFQKALLDSITGRDATRLAGTKTALAPFQTQLSDALTQEKDKTGYFKPFNYSFGGNAMPSFVPKNQLNTMNTALGVGRESSELGTRLVDQEYTAGKSGDLMKYGFESENLPNKASRTYLAELEKLFKYLNPNGQTTTTTATVPAPSGWATALQGAGQVANIYDKLYNPRTSTGGMTLEQLKAALGIA